jgi:hypothetical protein
LVEVLGQAGIKIEQHNNVALMADHLWNLHRDEQQVALAVLNQLCDCMVWWTQRYKNEA